MEIKMTKNWAALLMASDEDRSAKRGLASDSKAAIYLEVAFSLIAIFLKRIFDICANFSRVQALISGRSFSEVCLIKNILEVKHAKRRYQGRLLYDLPLFRQW